MDSCAAITAKQRELRRLITEVAQEQLAWIPTRGTRPNGLTETTPPVAYEF